METEIAQGYKRFRVHDAATANWAAHAKSIEEEVQRQWFELKRELKLQPRPLANPPDDNRAREEAEPIGERTLRKGRHGGGIARLLVDDLLCHVRTGEETGETQ